MKIFWYIFFVPFVYLFGTIVDIYFTCKDSICKRLKIGRFYKKLTPAELAENLIVRSQIDAKMIGQLRDVMKYL